MPDSKSVLFLSDRDGAWKLFKQRIDQPMAEDIVEGRNLVNALPRLSADGSQILFADLSRPDDASVPIRLMSMPLSGGMPRPIWMPDSKSVLFLSDRDGAWKLFKQRIDQPMAEDIVEGRNLVNALPRLSADGSQILFADLSRPDDASVPIRLMSMPLSGGMPR